MKKLTRNDLICRLPSRIFGTCADAKIVKLSYGRKFDSWVEMCCECTILNGDFHTFCKFIVLDILIIC